MERTEAAAAEGAAALTAMLVIEPPVLAHLLQLPEGAYIDAVSMPIDQPGRLLLRARGAGWPTVPGQLIPHTYGTVRVQRDAEGLITRQVVTWNLPQPRPRAWAMPGDGIGTEAPDDGGVAHAPR